MHMHEDARILMNANEYANTLTDGKAASVARSMVLRNNRFNVRVDAKPLE
jgi:hypothetical protein